jgi:hypothetical protein
VVAVAVAAEPKTVKSRRTVPMTHHKGEATPLQQSRFLHRMPYGNGFCAWWS